jgi:hypothetical protein
MVLNEYKLPCNSSRMGLILTIECLYAMEEPRRQEDVGGGSRKSLGNHSLLPDWEVTSRNLTRLWTELSVEILGEPCACIDLDTEKREGESLELYMRSVPLTTSPASGQLYIYMQHPDWTGARPVPSPDHQSTVQSSPKPRTGSVRTVDFTAVRTGGNIGIQL